MRASLLENVQDLLTRTYALEARLLPIGRYVIGDEGLRRRYDGEDTAIHAEAGDGARLLLRETPGGVRACIYYPDEMIQLLEGRPPQRGLDGENVDAFAVLVEELDHLLVTAERVHVGRPVSLLELEWHANVSKYLVLARFLAGGSGRLPAERRIWLRRRLFEERTYVHADHGVRGRYRDASRFAVRFLDTLRGEPAAARVVRLRRFHRAPLESKLEMITRA